MRIIVNRLAASGHKAGVGQYTERLLTACQRMKSDDVIDTFPAPWLFRIYEIGAGPGPRSAPVLSPANMKRLGMAARYVGRRAIRRLCRSRYAHQERTLAEGRNWDIYFEPNFIPLPSQLPTVTTLHDMSVIEHPEWHPAERVAWYEKNFARSLAQSAHFVAVSEFTRQQAIRTVGIAPEKITRVYNGVSKDFRPLADLDICQVRKRLGLPENYLLHIGTIEPRKNLSRLLDAFISLPAAIRKRCPLVLVGGWGWQYDDVARLYHDHARHRGVIRLGYVHSQDLPAVYNGARALVYPSLYEGFGLPPIEMMACGGAVLASTAAAVSEVTQGKACLLDPLDTDAWRKAMMRIVVDDHWREALRADARRTALAYSWDRCARETMAVLRLISGVSREPLPAAA